MILVELVVFFLLGTLFTEGFGYLWHRSVCHGGLLRNIFRDLLRRRHHDHHEHQYPDATVRRIRYASSCDISFRVLAVFLLGAISFLAATGWISPHAALALVAALLSHSLLGLKLHSIYHLPDDQIRRLAICRFQSGKRIIFWLRDFHDVHHVVNANYSLALPIFDIFGGTYISPEVLPALKREVLFPHFERSLSSSCGDQLL